MTSCRSRWNKKLHPCAKSKFTKTKSPNPVWISKYENFFEGILKLTFGQILDHKVLVTESSTLFCTKFYLVKIQTDLEKEWLLIFDTKERTTDYSYSLHSVLTRVSLRKFLCCFKMACVFLLFKGTVVHRSYLLLSTLNSILIPLQDNSRTVSLRHICTMSVQTYFSGLTYGLQVSIYLFITVSSILIY